MDTNHPDVNADAEAQRRGLLDAQRTANQDQPRNFKDDALTDKVVRVEPDGTGPTSTGAFDPERDRQHGWGNDAGSEAGNGSGSGTGNDASSDIGTGRARVGAEPSGKRSDKG